MALYELTHDRIHNVQQVTFSDVGFGERADLQRLLQERLDVICPGAMVLSDEFADWEDSRRRIDLLCLDKNANLVVVELKRTDDGGHMELQSLRYAAMVSTLTFEQAVEAHAVYRRRRGMDGDAKEAILGFLGWESAEEERFAPDVRIILASADFSKEITSTVLWLNERDVDITCVRMRPYRLHERVVVDVQQIVPLPEAEEYQVRVREKEQRERQASRALPSTTLDAVLTALESKDPVLAETARAIHAWLKERSTEVFMTSNGFAPRVRSGGVDHYFLKVTNSADVVLWFHYLRRHPPFSDEALRHELLTRLNAIPGVSIGPERVGGKPTFSLAALSDLGNRSRFFEALEWLFAKLVAAG